MMMRVSELVMMARSLRDDGSSPIADDAGAAYGIVRTRFVRSSASHVFWAGSSTEDDDVDLDLVLRLRPAARAGADALDDRCVRPAYDVEVWERVRGEVLEAEELTSGHLRAWGRTLRLFHLGGAVVARPAGLDWFAGRVLPAARALDRPRVDEVVGRLRSLPRDASRWGRVHGDAEPDNVVWRDAATPVLVDLDEVTTSWFGADVCFALRDLADEQGVPDPGDPRVQDFLAGYDDHGALLTDAWADFALAHTTVTAHRLSPVVAERVDPGWPDWARDLHARVSALQRRALDALQ